MLPVEGPGRVRCRTRRRRESSRGVCPFSRVSTRSETLVVQRIERCTEYTLGWMRFFNKLDLRKKLLKACCIFGTFISRDKIFML